MNKNAIKKFAIEARKKLIASVSDRAGMLGITPEGCSEPLSKGADFEVYKTIAGTEITLGKSQCEQRRKLKEQVETRGFEAVVEEVAYTWFNRICAIRFMEVNDYLPTRVRVLSSEKEGKNEPDIVTQALDVDLDFKDKEREYILDCKMNNKLDDLFKMLFIKQCNKLSEILPELFETTEDYTEMLLNISYTNTDDIIYMLVNPETGIPEADFNVSTIGEDGQPTGQVEIIGWLYQYYNTELKDDTFAQLKKNIKISKDRIPAATQLFTPDWIVRYMVENSVGRLWIEHLRAVDPMVNEKEVAEKFGWKYYLPEAEQEADVNVKLAEIRTSYKDLKPEDITCIDPCMGSGHILVAMFDVLMDIYKSAGYSERDAAFEIVEHNIHGLDIDKRAYQLAYFAVMMKGRRFNRRFLQGLGEKICSPKLSVVHESNCISLTHLQYFGVNITRREEAYQQIKRILEAYEDASEYGSIIRCTDIEWDLVEEYAKVYKVDEQISLESYGVEQTQKKLLALLKAARLMNQKYNVVITNPPYMGSGGMVDKLAEYVKYYYPDSKGDMSTVFMDAYVNALKKNGYIAMINIPVWMFIKSYTQLRNKILNGSTLINMLHLGRGVFGADFGTTSFVFRENSIDTYVGVYKKLFSTSSAVEAQEKKLSMFNEEASTYLQTQANIKKVPEYNFAYWVSDAYIKAFEMHTVSDMAEVKEGLKTGDNERFIRMWTEVDIADTNVLCNISNDKKWVKHTKGGEFRKWYGNNLELLNYANDGRELKAFKKSSLTGRENYFKECVTWSRITIAKTAFRFMPEGAIPNMAGLALYSNKNRLLLAYLNSIVAKSFLDILNPTINYPPGTIATVPVPDFSGISREIDGIVDENIEISKMDWDSFEISWDFKKHPLICERRIEEAYCLWEEECRRRFTTLRSNEERINKEFISLFGLENDLLYQVDSEDVTVRLADKKREVISFISYAVGCMFGRYSLDEEGIICAGSGFNSTKYRKYRVDEDNIIPITDAEYFTDDIVSKFIEFVATVYGEDNLEENLMYITSALELKGDNVKEKIRNYFLKDFYSDHLRVYQKKPIYWLFDSGKQNGFKALVYMHRYDLNTVGRVRTDYLHRTQDYIESARNSAEYTLSNSGVSSDKAKATKEIDKYTKQLAELKTYEEAIAHIATQCIEINLDDGVKVNYEKFQGVEVAQVCK